MPIEVTSVDTIKMLVYRPDGGVEREPAREVKDTCGPRYHSFPATKTGAKAPTPDTRAD